MMFNGCTEFNQPLNNWNTAKVTDMSGMFCGCTHLNQTKQNLCCYICVKFFHQQLS